MYTLLIKRFLIATFIISINSACDSTSKTTETDITDSISHTSAQNSNIARGIEWQNIRQETLPFIYNYSRDSSFSQVSSIEDFFAHEKVIKSHQELNRLFKPGTYLLNREYSAGHPMNQPGYFFKRLPDAGINKLLLFVYTNPYAETEGYKLPSIELQIFDGKQQLVDRMIVGDGLSNECSWMRSFSYSKDMIISLSDQEECVDLTSVTINNDKARIVSKNTDTYFYKVKPTGKIVRYFKNLSGEITENISDFNHTAKNKYVSKGKINNHYKQGLWEEIEPDMYKLDESDSYTHLIKGFGYYKDGEKDGEWLYYRIDENNGYSGSPRLAQRYKEGKLVEQTSESDAMENYTLTKKVDSLRNK